MSKLKNQYLALVLLLGFGGSPVALAEESPKGLQEVVRKASLCLSKLRSSKLKPHVSVSPNIERELRAWSFSPDNLEKFEAYQKMVNDVFEMAGHSINFSKVPLTKTQEKEMENLVRDHNCHFLFEKTGKYQFVFKEMLAKGPLEIASSHSPQLRATGSK